MMKFFWICVALFASETSQAQLSYLRGPRKNLSAQFSIQQDLQDHKNQNQNLDGKLSLYLLKDTKNKVFVMGNFSRLDHGVRDLKVGKNLTPVDSVLFNHNLGISFSRNLNQKGRSAGFSLNFGTASDAPFGETQNNALTFNAFYSLDKEPKSQWFFVLNYSNNRAFLKNIPLPSVGYKYSPSKKFHAFLGVPFVVLTWVDFPKYIHNIVLTPGSLKLDFSWGVLGPIRFYSLAQYSNSSYMHDQRQEEDLRLYAEEKKIQIGLRGPISRKVSLELGLGYGFDRKVFEGESLFKPEGDKVSLADQPYGFFQFKLDL